jgi:hypothetical protein
MHRRALTDGETTVLALIQQAYGSHNGFGKVFFAADEPVLFVEASDGTLHLVANLSDLRHACGRAQFPAMTK